MQLSLSFGGVALVSLSDSSQPQSPGAVSYVRLRADRLTTFASKHILGDALALLSALFYALYVILLKVRIRQESRIDMQLFFGFVGLFNILFCWPIGIILHFTGVEKFELPHGSSVVLALLINVVFIQLKPRFTHVLIFRVDGDHVVKRLYLCLSHAQDNAVGRNHWPQSNDAFSSAW